MKDRCVCNNEKSIYQELCQFCIAGLNCLELNDKASPDDIEKANIHIRNGNAKHILRLFFMKFKKK